MNIKKMLTEEKDRLFKRNLKYKEFENPENAFQRIYESSLNREYDFFKQPENASNYIKETMKLLGIEIKTDENW